MYIGVGYLDLVKTEVGYKLLSSVYISEASTGHAAGRGLYNRSV